MSLFFVCTLCSAQVIAPSLAAPESGDASARVSQWQPVISEAAQRFAIPEDWIRSVMAAESGGRNTLAGRPITSTAGAMGLMQVMPRTYGDLSRRYGLGANSYEPHNNIFAGAAYLREMYLRYGYPLLFAAYNTGPGRLDDYLLRRIPLPAETKSYVGTILPGTSELVFSGVPDGNSTSHFSPEIAHTPAAKTISAGLFFVAPAAQGEFSSTANRSQLFVPLSAEVPTSNRK